MKKRSEKQEDLDKLKVVLAKVSTVILSTFQGITGVATDQLALSLQEIPSSNAMEMGQIMQAVGHE